MVYFLALEIALTKSEKFKTILRSFKNIFPTIFFKMMNQFFMISAGILDIVSISNGSYNLSKPWRLFVEHTCEDEIHNSSLLLNDSCSNSDKKMKFPI